MTTVHNNLPQFKIEFVSCSSSCAWWLLLEFSMACAGGGSIPPFSLFLLSALCFSLWKTLKMGCKWGIKAIGGA